MNLKITSANVCGNNYAATNLNYHGNARIFDLVFRLAHDNHPDIIAIQEIPYKWLGLLESSLAQLGYKMIINKNFFLAPRKGSFTALSVMFIKATLKFEEQYRSGFETQFRCVVGVLTVEGQKIFIRNNHVPCVGSESNRGRGGANEKQIKRKRDFLADELDYQRSLDEDNELAISLGDYNTAANGNFHCKELFTQLTFTDLIGDEPTWGGSALDHLFVSKALVESGIPIKHRLITSNLTDHKILELELTL